MTVLFSVEDIACVKIDIEDAKSHISYLIRKTKQKKGNFYSLRRLIAYG